MRTSDPELHLRRRGEIVAAAEHCFVKRGFHQSSMQNIADAAGVSMGLLYRYFANKEAIIEAAAEQDQADVLAHVAALPDESAVISAWIALIVALAAQCAAPDYAGLASEILSEANRSAKIRAFLTRNDSAMVAACAAKLETQAASGAIVLRNNSATAAQSLLLICDGLTMRYFMAGRVPEIDRLDSDYSIDQLVRAILE